MVSVSTQRVPQAVEPFAHEGAHRLFGVQTAHGSPGPESVPSPPSWPTVASSFVPPESEPVVASSPGTVASGPLLVPVSGPADASRKTGGCVGTTQTKTEKCVVWAAACVASTSDVWSAV